MQSEKHANYCLRFLTLYKMNLSYKHVLFQVVLGILPRQQGWGEKDNKLTKTLHIDYFRGQVVNRGVCSSSEDVPAKYHIYYSSN